jgi:NADH dehydrogenase (ubiquinone) 1 alpha subcomplex subunit 12
MAVRDVLLRNMIRNNNKGIMTIIRDNNSTNLLNFVINAKSQKTRQIQTSSYSKNSNNIVQTTGGSTLLKILDGSVNWLNHKRGRLVGTDQFENEYYENTQLQQGRSRWVKYKDLNDYNPANVPREWHQWLHYISDEPDLKQEVKYEIPAVYMKLSKQFGAVASNEGRHYPKGHFFNKKGIKDWKKYKAWTPP